MLVYIFALWQGEARLYGRHADADLNVADAISALTGPTIPPKPGEDRLHRQVLPRSEPICLIWTMHYYVFLPANFRTAPTAGFKC